MKQLMILLITFTAAFAEPAGKFIFVTGKVQILENGAWKEAQAGMFVSAGSEIQTGLKSRAILKFGNGSEMKINAGTLVSLADYREGGFGTETNVDLKMGKITAAVARHEKAKNHFNVRTPTVVAAVRGTIEKIAYTPEGGTRIDLVESSAEVKSRRGRFIVSEGNSGSERDGEVLQSHENRREDRSTRAANPSAAASELQSFIRSGRPVPGGVVMDRGRLGDRAIQQIRDNYLPLIEEVGISIEKL